MKKILIYAEQHHTQSIIDLLEVAKQLFKDEEYETYAYCIHKEVEPLIGMFDVILYSRDSLLHTYNQKEIGEVISQLHNRYHFDAIVFLATNMGRCIAPRVAMKLHTGLVADVTKISHSEKGLVLIRPAYSGRIMAGIQITGMGPVMMSVREGVFTYGKEHVVSSRIVELENITYSHGSIIEKNREEKIIPYDIRKSNVLISAGGGVNDSIQELFTLATLLKGEVSASRAVVDKGIVSRSIQVGQSGKRVSPSLYIALGIHGAIQHIEGLKEVPFIISVNTNKNAPICSISDIVVEGDALTFIHRLVKRIEKGAT